MTGCRPDDGSYAGTELPVAAHYDTHAVMSDLQIIPYTPEQRSAVLDLTVAAWSPVFARTRHEVPGFVYDAFYPNGWQARQIEDVGALLDQSEVSVWLLLDGQHLLGLLGFQLHPEDQMGAIHIIAIAPDRQGRVLVST